LCNVLRGCTKCNDCHPTRIFV